MEKLCRYPRGCSPGKRYCASNLRRWLRRLCGGRRRRSLRRWRNRGERLGRRPPSSSRRPSGRSCGPWRVSSFARTLREAILHGQSQPVKVYFEKRGASSAAWMFILKSTTSATNCAWACAWFQPPMMPKAMRTSPFCAKAGMMVWSGRLCPASALGEVGIESEKAAAIVQREAGARRDDAGAEAGVVALDQRDHVAVAIDDGEIGGVASRAAASPAVDVAIGVIGVDQFGALGRPILWRAASRPAISGRADRRCISRDRCRRVFWLRSSAWSAFGEPKPQSFSPSGNFSMMLSISSAAMPCPLGGIS